MILAPGPHTGIVSLPVSKSHFHRVLIADFLAGKMRLMNDTPEDCSDILATKRCLRALFRDCPHDSDGVCPHGLAGTDPISSGDRPHGLAGTDPISRGDRPHGLKGTDPMSWGGRPHVLDCGESGTTRRLIGPVAAALGWSGKFVLRGRLAERPQIDYSDGIKSGLHELRGDVSSQFASGLLFALPLLGGDSEICFTTPLVSGGYVDLTRRVLSEYGIFIEVTPTGFRVPGSQRYQAPLTPPFIERDWSSAAFWLAMNALGSSIGFDQKSAAMLKPDSLQPDRAVVGILCDFSHEGCVVLDVSSFPDLFPVLTVVAACRKGETRFVGTRRLRAKESDRVAAMTEVLAGFGRELRAEDDAVVVIGSAAPLRGGERFRSFGDHRVAMSIAVGATVASAPIELDDVSCVDKSYPGFFKFFEVTK